MIPIAPSSGGQNSAAQGNLSPEMVKRVLDANGVYLLKIPYDVVNDQFVYLDYGKVNKKNLNLLALFSLVPIWIILLYWEADTALRAMTFTVAVLIVAIIWLTAIEYKTKKSVNCIPITQAIKQFLPEKSDIVSMNFDWYNGMVRVYYVEKQAEQPKQPQKSS